MLFSACAGNLPFPFAIAAQGSAQLGRSALLHPVPFDERGVHGTFDEGRVIEDLAMDRDRRLAPLHDEL
jgi:hypothetical protein